VQHELMPAGPHTGGRFAQLGPAAPSPPTKPPSPTGSNAIRPQAATATATMTMRPTPR